MDEYEINEKTLAVVPLANGKTKILEDTEVYTVNKSAIKIMEDSCQFFGSSLLGRQKGTTRLIGVSHKAPIIIEESKEIIFFPTSSPRKSMCSWLSLKNIDRYYTKNKSVLIKFKNNVQLELSLSYGIVDNQVLRATRLESVLRSRKN